MGKVCFSDSSLNHFGLAKKSLQMNKLNEGQAVQPENCRLLKNDVGTACGMCFERNGKLLFSLPGVPMEILDG